MLFGRAMTARWYRVERRAGGPRFAGSYDAVVGTSNDGHLRQSDYGRSHMTL
jgi:hypothetical protein